MTSRPRPAQTASHTAPGPVAPTPGNPAHQLEPVVDSDALLPCAPGALATWPPLWSFFRIIVITKAKWQGAGPEGLLSALFPPQPPEGSA